MAICIIDQIWAQPSLSPQLKEHLKINEIAKSGGEML